MYTLPFIERGDTGSIDFQNKSRRRTPFILGIYVVGILIFFISISIRLFRLTIVRGAYFYSLAKQNRVREIIIEPKRGTIYDRKGIVLASNTDSHEATTSGRITSARRYIHGDELGHLVGYRQLADADDLLHDPCLNKLILGDKTGKKGVEKIKECQLRGENGKRLIEIDAMGKSLRVLSESPPIDGERVDLAQDSYLQDVAFKAMQGKKGAVIGVNPKNGEIMLLVSSPGFDSQVFENNSSAEVSALFKDQNKPLFNRVTEGTYPPGSTFKLFVAAAGLEEGVLTPETSIEDKGVLQAGPLVFHNWYYLEYGKMEGEVNMVKALQRSNDIYFYTLGAKLGPEKIKKWGELFGLHTKSNLGLEESEGILPSAYWKEDVLHEQWYLGDTYNLSIGQGYVASTPLQIAMGTSVFANGGNYCKATLFKSDADSSSSFNCRHVSLNKLTYTTIREGMKKACETGGTGWPFFEFSPRVGCKTGTAESHAQSGKPHAWFTVFAPFEKPEIVITVLIEEGGQGSDVAAPIAKEILSAYFTRSE